MHETGGGTPGCLAVGAMFVVVAAPVYLLMRFLLGLARDAYGFSPVEEGPPLRICAACHNTVLEDDFEHCPYCGAELPEVSAAESLAKRSSGPL